jgi:hypothetical protein
LGISIQLEKGKIWGKEVLIIMNFILFDTVSHANKIQTFYIDGLASFRETPQTGPNEAL